MIVAPLIALAVLAGTLIGNAPARPDALPAGTVAQTSTPPGTQTTTAPPTSGQEDCGCGVPANPRGPR
jgi:hypothetical protein